MSAIGTGGPSVLSMYAVHESMVAWGESHDRQTADPSSRPYLTKLEPFVRGRMLLQELLG